MQLFAANFIPLIRSTISTVSTASGTNHSIVSATFFQRGLVLTSEAVMCQLTANSCIWLVI